MREQPESVLKRLEQAVHALTSALWSQRSVTYAGMRFGATGQKPRRAIFSWSTRSARASDAILPWTGGHPVGPMRRCPVGALLPRRDADRPNDTVLPAPSRGNAIW
jgi:hypothetical protein